MSEEIDLGDAEQVPVGEARCFEVRGRRIAVFHTAGGSYYALDDLCSHAEASLAAGEFDESCVTCPWHGASFSLRDGSAETPPASSPVASYGLERRGRRLYLTWID